jgi:AraC-like DNA-binding protein
MPQILQVHPTAPALRPFVEVLWHFEGADLRHVRERILPTGTMQLLVNLHEDELRTYRGDGFEQVERIRGAGLSGAYAAPFGIDTAEQRWVVGVQFKPGGAAPFLPAPADALSEDHVEIDALWGRDGAVLRERILEAPTPAAKLRTLEAALLERAVRPFEVDECVEFAVAACNRGVPIRDLTARLGMTPRRFTRRFRESVGLSPKRFARVRRFAQVLRAIQVGGPVDWSRVAADCGYYDQAHLIRDFREFSGVSPTGYRARANREGNHMVIDDLTTCRRSAPRTRRTGA